MVLVRTSWLTRRDFPVLTVLSALFTVQGPSAVVSDYVDSLQDTRKYLTDQPY